MSCAWLLCGRPRAPGKTKSSVALRTASWPGNSAASSADAATERPPVDRGGPLMCVGASPDGAPLSITKSAQPVGSLPLMCGWVRHRLASRGQRDLLSLSPALQPSGWLVGNQSQLMHRYIRRSPMDGRFECPANTGVHFYPHHVLADSSRWALSRVSASTSLLRSVHDRSASDIPDRLPNNWLTAVCALCIICINNLMVGHLLFWRKQASASVCDADVRTGRRDLVFSGGKIE